MLIICLLIGLPKPPRRPPGCPVADSQLERNRTTVSVKVATETGNYLIGADRVPLSWNIWLSYFQRQITMSGLRPFSSDNALSLSTILP